MKDKGAREIALGVTGGIAAYKAAEVVRLLARAAVGVTVILTRNAESFITPLTLQALSGRRVIRDMHDLSEGGDIEHITLSRNIGLLAVVPATASTLARFAQGFSEDFLSAFFLAVSCPVLVAPSMNSRMYRHPATQQNLAVLRGRGVRVLEPDTGSLACGEEGIGRLPDPEKIVSEILRILGRREFWSRQTVLVTAGPTREFLDPMRILTNPSTGRMGYAVAEEAAIRGAGVILVSGPSALPEPWGAKMIRVEATEEMRARRLKREAAEEAPADFRPVESSREKTPKGSLSLALEPTPDILAEIGARKEGRYLVGFAAETGEIRARALAKLREKNLDLVVANQVGRPDSGFASETNQVTFLSARGEEESLPLLSKREVAVRLLDRIEATIAESR